MRRSCSRLIPVLMMAAFSAASGQTHSHNPAAPATKGAGLLPGMGSYHRPIATKSPEAQRFFDQGLTLMFGFNHDEAIRSFEKAAKLDASAAMPLWGIAYSLGPNINMPVDPAGEKRAFDAVQKALVLAAKAPENERAYIEALAKRYSDNPKADLQALARDYADAMGQVSERYPDDLDAATLYAEAMMDLRPWKLYTTSGEPVEGTEKIVSVLESVLKRNPMHPGANHYYIHAVEASTHPERALPSAQRLEKLVPGAGHLVHMPSHIYERTGDYDRAAKSNAEAAAADEAYIRRTGAKGMYPLAYYSHNLHFKAYADAVVGRYTAARAAADKVVANVMPGLKEMPMLETFIVVPTFVDLFFAKWDVILKTPEPPAVAPTARGLWHYARGVALAANSRVEQAEKEREAVKRIREEIPEEMMFGGTQLSPARRVLDLASSALEARIASARGEPSVAQRAWEDAIRVEDSLAYDEPPTWFTSTRVSMGAELLRDSRFSEAEKVFRDELDRNPRNPRALFGLSESLKAQGKLVDAGWIDRQLKVEWKNPEAPLRVKDL
jgi:tetratricopeptide (TPR) repeat protein